MTPTAVEKREREPNEAEVENRAAPSSDMHQEVIYLLGIALQADRELVVEITSLFPAVVVTSYEQLDIWHVLVDREQFEGEAAEANLADANWLTPRVLAHQAVLEYFAARLPLLPMSFGTLYSSLESLCLSIAPHRTTIVDFLCKIRGHSEWGLKCFVAWDAAYDQTQNEPDRVLSGSDYLRRKKSIRQREASLRQVAEEQLQQVVELAHSFSAEAVLRRSLNVSADGECASNIALLIDNQRIAPLQAWVNSVNASTSTTCIRLELTGPWPTYSFAPPLHSLPATHTAPSI